MVCKSTDPLKLVAESVDLHKKSTKSESGNGLPRVRYARSKATFVLGVALRDFMF